MPSRASAVYTQQWDEVSLRAQTASSHREVYRIRRGHCEDQASYQTEVLRCKVIVATIDLVHAIGIESSGVWRALACTVVMRLQTYSSP
jgi:hypothetical protein